MVETVDKDIFATLTEAVEALTQKNASLTTQLSNATKINVDMAKKLSINPTQEPKEKKPADKVNRKAALDRNLDPYGYYWTHRFRVTNRHISQMGSAPVAGHQREETRKNIMGGSEAGK